MKRSALLLVISIAAFGYNGDQVKRLRQNGPPGANILAVGEESPRFVLQKTDGEDLALEDVLEDNHLVLLNFWATWCPICWIEMLELEKAYREYQPLGLEVLAIAVDNPDDVRTYTELQPLSYPVLLDPDGVVAGRFGVDALPTSVLVGKDGTVLRTCQGITYDLANQLAAFLSEE
jgi:peroxiredoxin